MNGSLRQRGASSWELRVYDGIDPDTGKERYATRTTAVARARFGEGDLIAIDVVSLRYTGNV